MATGFGNQSEVTYMDISGDSRSWAEVVPDQYFGPEHVLGKEVTLQIQQIVSEKYDDASIPRAVLRFANDKKWLRLSKDNKQVLKEMFGDSPSAAIGKWIVITAGPNNMKNIVVKILPRHVTSQGTVTTGYIAPAAQQSPLSAATQGDLAAMQQQLQTLLAQQAAAAAGQQLINPVEQLLASSPNGQLAAAGGAAGPRF